MADPAGPFGFGYTGDGKYMIVRPGVQTDHLMLTNPTAAPGATTGLALDGSNRLVTVAIPSGSAGDVVGPGSATDEALVRFDGATGKLIQNSIVTLSDTGNMTFNAPAVGVLSLAAGSAAGVVFPTPAGTPAPTTTQLSVYARRASAAVSWIGPYAAPVAGTITIERVGNLVMLAVAGTSSAGTIAAAISLSAPLPAWAIPTTSVAGMVRTVNNNATTAGVWIVSAAGIITFVPDNTNLATVFSAAGGLDGFGYTSDDVTIAYTI